MIVTFVLWHDKMAFRPFVPYLERTVHTQITSLNLEKHDGKGTSCVPAGVPWYDWTWPENRVNLVKKSPGNARGKIYRDGSVCAGFRAGFSCCRGRATATRLFPSPPLHLNYSPGRIPKRGAQSGWKTTRLRLGAKWRSRFETHFRAQKSRREYRKGVDVY